LSTNAITLLVLVCTLVAGLAGIGLRRVLPADHLDEDSKDAIKLVMGLIATITALVLGLLISSAHGTFETEDAEVRALGVNIYELDRMLARFGPDAARERATLRRMVAGDLSQLWPANATTVAGQVTAATVREGSDLFDGIAMLTPRNDLQKYGQSRALQLFTSVSETRRTLAEQARRALAWPLLAVLVAWLTLLFFAFGLFARYNTTVVVTFLIGSVSVAGALFLILEMNQPFNGWIQLSASPLHDALAQMGP